MLFLETETEENKSKKKDGPDTLTKKP